VLLATSGSTRTAPLRIRVAALREGEVVRLRSGLLVTSPRRTVVDCLRTLPAPDALAIADAAARRWLLREDLVRAVEAIEGWPGARRARRLLAVVDGRRETAFESWSALAFDQHGVPQPCWQVELRDALGFIGRVDGWWQQGVAGEADGRSKYALRAAERGGADAAGLERVLHAERRREQRIRRTGADLVRWSPADVLNPRRAAELAGFVLTRLAARSGLPFTGTAGPAPDPRRVPVPARLINRATG
jgi:hypothetical protein